MDKLSCVVIQPLLEIQMDANSHRANRNRTTARWRCARLERLESRDLLAGLVDSSQIDSQQVVEWEQDWESIPSDVASDLPATDGLLPATDGLLIDHQAWIDIGQVISDDTVSDVVDEDVESPIGDDILDGSDAVGDGTSDGESVDEEQIQQDDQDDSVVDGSSGTIDVPMNNHLGKNNGMIDISVDATWNYQLSGRVTTGMGPVLGGSTSNFYESESVTPPDPIDHSIGVDSGSSEQWGPAGPVDIFGGAVDQEKTLGDSDVSPVGPFPATENSVRDTGGFGALEDNGSVASDPSPQATPTLNRGVGVGSQMLGIGTLSVRQTVSRVTSDTSLGDDSIVSSADGYRYFRTDGGAERRASSARTRRDYAARDQFFAVIVDDRVTLAEREVVASKGDQRGDGMSESQSGASQGQQVASQTISTRMRLQERRLADRFAGHGTSNERAVSSAQPGRIAGMLHMLAPMLTWFATTETAMPSTAGELNSESSATSVDTEVPTEAAADAELSSSAAPATTQRRAVGSLFVLTTFAVAKSVAPSSRKPNNP